MTKLDERKQKILTALVEDYVKTAQPVSSSFLAVKHGLNVSPATVRNEMAELEETGYIVQPHTSAGRVPTDKGYRYYVNELMKAKPLTQRETQLIDHQLLMFKETLGDIEDVISNTLKTLSFLSRYATAMLAPKVYKSGEKIVAKEKVYSSGISNILKLPEFSEVSHAREVIELFDEEEKLAELFKGNASSSSVSITIGKENRNKRLKDMSIVMTTYEQGESMSGMIGVIGPKRMFYDHTTAVVSKVAESLRSFFMKEE